MIELIATRQSDQVRISLDVPQESFIRATKQVLDIRDPTSKKTDFSREFSLPYTAVNTDFFNGFQDIGIVGSTFSPYAETDCMLTEDGSVIIEGKLQLKSVDVNRGYYQVVVFGNVNTISNAVKGLLLRDIDFSALDHDVTDANIEASWDGNLDYYYAWIDWGYGYGYSRDITDSSEPFKYIDLFTAVKLRWLLYAIFEQSGFQLKSAFLDTSEFDRLFFQPEALERLPDAATPVATLEPLFDGGDPIISTDDDIDTDLGLGVSSVVSNVQGIWRFLGGVDGFWRAPNAGTYTFDFSIALRLGVIGGTIGTRNASIVFKSGSQSGSVIATINFPAFSFIFPSGSNNIYESTLITSVNISLADQEAVYPMLRIGGNSGGTGNTWAWVDTPSVDDVFGMVDGPPFIQNTPSDIAFNIGGTTQIDLLRDFLRFYNCVLLPDPDSPTAYEIKPIVTWLEEGGVLDWSAKLDIGKESKILPLTDLLAQDLYYKFKDSSDFLSSEYDKQFGITYGAFRQKSGVAYSQEEQRIELLFAPFPIAELENVAGMFMHHKVKDLTGINDQSVERTAPNLIYANGYKQCTTYFYERVSTAVASRSYYPLCSHYLIYNSDPFSDPPLVQADTKTLNWSITSDYTPDNLIGTPSANTIYVRHWESFNLQLYNEDNRILIAHIELNGLEISNLELNEEIHLNFRGTLERYFINKIVEYLVNGSESTKVELIKRA